MDLAYEIFKPNTITASSGFTKTVDFDPGYSGPLVSCVMVTRGNPELVKKSIGYFVNQSWRNKELVIVTDRVSKKLKGVLDAELSEVTYHLVNVPAGLTLGDYRNISVSNSSGEYICQWDDDDIYHPDRISACMRVLLKSGSSAVFLSRWTMIWPARNLACVSESRIWEGSMISRRDVVPVYPSLKRTEDTEMVDMLCRHHQISLLDYPKLYFYTVTGENTNTDDHFTGLFNRATLTYNDYGLFVSTMELEIKP
jgi:glycosyltransferase involved in cell wall biosynthesis